MGYAPTTDVIHAQRPEGRKTKVSAPRPGKMPKSIQKQPIESQTSNKPVVIDLTQGDDDDANKPVVIDLTQEDDNAEANSKAPPPQTISTNSEPCHPPAEKTPKGTLNPREPAHDSRGGVDRTHTGGVQKPRGSKRSRRKSNSLGTTIKAHAGLMAQCNVVEGPRPAVAVNLYMRPDELKDFPRVLARAAETDARVQGVFKITLRLEGEKGHNVCTDYPSSVLKFLKRQEERLESNSPLKLPYRAGIPLRSPEEREEMGLGEESLIHPLDGNRLAQTTRFIDGIHYPRCYETGLVEWTPLMMSLEECNLHSVHLLYEGRKVWICVSPGTRRRFEARMRKEIARMRDGNDKTSRCGQFARHARLYFRISMLKAWGIEYTIVDQKAGDVVVTLPGTYHQGFTVGRTKAEVMNYADEKWTPSKILWCDIECPEYTIDPHDMHLDVVKARMPEASIDQRGETHQADEYKVRNENGQLPAIATNLGRSLTPYGAAFIRAYMDNGLDLDNLRKVRLLQMIMQCEWPGPGDITPNSAGAIIRADRLVSVSTIRMVDRMGGEPPLVDNFFLQLRTTHMRALHQIARTHGRPAGHFRRLLGPGVILEHMARELGPHILLTLPTHHVQERDFAPRVDHHLLKLPIEASSYHQLEGDAALYFVRHFYDLRPHLRFSQDLGLQLQNMIDILGIEQWVRDKLWPEEGQEVV